MNQKQEKKGNKKYFGVFFNLNNDGNLLLSFLHQMYILVKIEMAKEPGGYQSPPLDESLFLRPK